MNEPIKPHCLLKKVEEQELAAKKFGFYWERLEQLIRQIHSECQEIQEAWEGNDSQHLQEEIGDLIQAAIGLAVYCQVDPHETLHKSIQKFQLRYDTLVEMAKKDGLTTLEAQPFDVLMRYWNQAKLKTKNR